VVVVPALRPAPPPKTHDWVLRPSVAGVKAPGDFRLVGVVWPARSRAPSKVEARTSRDGKRWSRWSSLDIDSAGAPDVGHERNGIAGTEPLWVGRARFAAVRFGGRVPARASLRVIDPGSLAAAPPARAAFASPAMPSVVTRAQWGADESMRKPPVQVAPELRTVIIHHTATGNDYGPADSASIVRAIYAYHVRGRGWDDIGYNFLVDRFGQIFEGRSGGMDKAVVGAHAAGFNTGSSGISVIGTFTDLGPPADALRAVRDIAAWKLDLHNVDPRGEAMVTSGGSPRFPPGTQVRLPNVTTHRDVGETECPGDAFYSLIPWLRDEIAKFGDPKVFSPRFALPALTPNGDGLADTASWSARFSSSVGWKADLVDGSGSILKTWSGSGDSAALTWDGKDALGNVQPHGSYRVRLTATGAAGGVRPVETPVFVWAWPDGTLLGSRSGSFVLSDGRLRPISPAAMRSRYRTGEAIAVPDFVRAAYPAGSATGFREGALVRADGRVWLISGGSRREIGADAMRALGYDESSVIEASSDEMGVHEAGPPVTPGPRHPDGTALRGDAMPTTWKLVGSARTMSDAVRTSYNIRSQDMVGPADSEIADSGPLSPLAFRDGSLLRTETTGRLFVVSDGMRRAITTRERFDAFGYQWVNVLAVSEAEAELTPEGPPL
jgi:hypothetical protein